MDSSNIEQSVAIPNLLKLKQLIASINQDWWCNKDYITAEGNVVLYPFFKRVDYPWILSIVPWILLTAFWVEFAFIITLIMSSCFWTNNGDRWWDIAKFLMLCSPVISTIIVWKWCKKKEAQFPTFFKITDDKIIIQKGEKIEQEYKQGSGGNSSSSFDWRSNYRNEGAYYSSGNSGFGSTGIVNVIYKGKYITEIKFADVESINVSQGLSQWLFGIGDITININSP